MISTLYSFSGVSSDGMLLTVFAAGTAASLGLCALVRLPLVLAYITGMAASKRHGIILSGLFVSGLIVGTVLLGLMAGPPEEGLRPVLYFSGRLLVVLGIGLFVTGILLSGLINPRWLPARWQKAAGRLAGTGSPGAFLLGCALGLLQTPAYPHGGAAIRNLVEIAAGGSLLRGLALFACFAAGQGLTMFAVGFMTSLAMPDLLRRLRTKMCSIEHRIQLLAGNVLMVLGLYFVIVS